MFTKKIIKQSQQKRKKDLDDFSFFSYSKSFLKRPIDDTEC